MLVLLYYFSQNPDFHESVKPIMEQLKNSEQMLAFLNDLSKFSQTFGNSKGESPKQEKDEHPKEDCNQEKTQSPTQGIADEFIQQILDGYLNKTK